MAQSNITMGPSAKLYIENTDFVWTGGQFTLNWKEHDTNDSSLTTWDQFRRGRGRANLNGTFQSENNRNIHAGPYNLGNDEFVSIKVYPDGDGDGLDPYEFEMLATAIQFDMPVKAGDPVSGTITGGSTGTVTKPGDT